MHIKSVGKLLCNTFCRGSCLRVSTRGKSPVECRSPFRVTPRSNLRSATHELEVAQAFFLCIRCRTVPGIQAPYEYSPPYPLAKSYDGDTDRAGSPRDA